MNNIRSPNFPQVPLLEETGYSGPPSRSWYGIFAPAGTPKAIVDRVSKDINEVIAKPEFRDRHLTARSLVPAANTPEKFAEDIKRERLTAEKVVRDAGFEAQ
jgi:tripartite-type tricarboxylate transporter receptor subunit TctC